MKILTKTEFRQQMQTIRAEYLALLAKAATPQQRRTLRRAIQATREMEIAA